jgi:TetR/AcrR family transcriptional repressor of nem operon
MVAAGLTKGGFYRHFESKDQLIAEAHVAASDAMIKHCESAVVGKLPRDALDTLVKLYLYQSLEESPAWLCPLPLLSSELRNADETVRKVAMEGYKRAVGFVAMFTEKLNVPNHLGVADAIIAAMVGAVMLSRLAPHRDVARAIIDSAQHAVNALLLVASPTAR